MQPVLIADAPHMNINIWHSCCGADAWEIGGPRFSIWFEQNIVVYEEPANTLCGYRGVCWLRLPFSVEDDLRRAAATAWLLWHNQRDEWTDCADEWR